MKITRHQDTVTRIFRLSANHYCHQNRINHRFLQGRTKKMRLRGMGLFCLLWMLTGCFGPESPQEVTQAFWNSVLENDSKGVIRYSTLTDEELHDGFSQNWSGFQPSWGRVVIDGNEAVIIADFLKGNGSGENNRRVVTHLIKEQQQWKVDYARTNKQLQGGSFANLLELFDRIGKDVSDHFKSSADTLSDDIERLSEQFSQLSDDIGQQASKRLEQYAEQLRQKLKELADSVQRALKEQDKQLSPDDRWTMNAVIANLNSSSDQLADSSFDSIANSSQTVAVAWKQLATTDDDTLGTYKAKWQQWEQEFEATVQQVIEDFSMLTKDRT